MTMSFTMNWKIMRPGHPVRFEVGEPLFQAIPLLSNVCSDIEGASVTYKKLDDDPEVAQSYREWDQSRSGSWSGARPASSSPTSGRGIISSVATPRDGSRPRFT